MKVTITKSANRIALIKFFRSYIHNLTLLKAVYYADNLPYVFEGLGKADAKDLRDQIGDCATCLIEEEPKDMDYYCPTSIYNININPPEEYLDALAWYESCSEEHKKYIDQIVLWRSRPAVC